MIRSLQILQYRGFDAFEMTGLGRVNLLVGTNNSGKTSVLEAVHLLASGGDPYALWRTLGRRGERLQEEREQRYPGPEMDVCHLFHGHEIRIGAEFAILARNGTPERSVTVSIGEVSPADEPKLFDDEPDVLGPRLGVHIKGSAFQPWVIPLTHRGGLSSDAVQAPRRFRRDRADQAAAVQYIATESLSSDELVYLWESIALTAREDMVLDALRCLDPNIERIASASSSRYGGGDRGGFIIKLRGCDQPIPIGTMGDGMWRMLAMAVAISRCKGGVLLVDEIDTGLHYTVMGDMWRLIDRASHDLDVQVFATTHSGDCVKSLATICRAGADGGDEITIQRIEPLRHTAVPYSETEIEVAAEQQIEVR